MKIFAIELPAKLELLDLLALVDECLPFPSLLEIA
jgi:hypothetical protein